MPKKVNQEESWKDFCEKKGIPEHGDPYSTEQLNGGGSFGVCSGCPKVVDQTQKKCGECLQNLLS